MPRTSTKRWVTPSNMGISLGIGHASTAKGSAGLAVGDCSSADWYPKPQPVNGTPDASRFGLQHDSVGERCREVLGVGGGVDRRRSGIVVTEELLDD